MVSGKSNRKFNITMRGCKVCNHPKRDEIEAGVYLRQNYTDIADHISAGHEIIINRQNIQRHYKYHMPAMESVNVGEMIDTGAYEKRKTAEELSGMFDEVDDLIERLIETETADFSEMNAKAKTLVQLYGLKSRLINQNKDIIQDVKITEEKAITRDVANFLASVRSKKQNKE